MANSTNLISQAHDSGHDDLGIKTPVTTGICIVILFFGVFGVWATIAPLESAVIAIGVVSVDSQRKTIQHLEGGIVREIHIKEAQKVKAGDILIQLDDTHARANLDLLKSRYLAARALEARLLAERDRDESITFPEELMRQHLGDDVIDIKEVQTSIFNAHRQATGERIAIMEQRIKQVEEEILGLNGLLKTQDDQLYLVKDEMESNKQLFEKGLTGKARLRTLQRAMADVIGERSQNLAAVARAKQNIEETRLQITELKTSTLNEMVEQLSEARSNIYDLIEKVRAAEDVLKRTVIQSQVAGTIVNLQVHTNGGVIAPGQELMDIVPEGDRLIVEARVHPNDIEVMKPGLNALVRLTAFSQRIVQPIEGEVISVSADHLTDARSGVDFFLARVEITGEITEGISLYPGMQAEVMIVTGTRTTLDYLTRPITQSINRAFREN